jgi:small subunit ribosomal protein S20
MANHKSAEKRHRQSLRRREHNRVGRTAVRTALKKARAALEKKDSSAKEAVLAAEKALSKAASKGLIHKNSAARKIGRLKVALTKAA